MKNKVKKTFIGLGAVALILATPIVFSEPGTETDPLVTQSYVTNSINQLKNYIDSKISNISGSGGTSNEFVVVNLEVGEQLIGGASTEIILRAGQATAVALSDGLSDVTDGKDLKMGVSIPKNHLLIIPRDDGRGVTATTSAVFMVRGAYIIR